MKKIFYLLFLLLISTNTFAQEEDTLQPIDDKKYKILTSDGNEVIGQILKKDAREILFRTDDERVLYIPQYIIQNIEEVKPEDYNLQGDYVGEDRFATRYFISTNGLPMKKGDNYIQWNWFGPDLQFGVADNFGIGVMTSWLAIPIVVTGKYSFQLSENAHLGVGALLGHTATGALWGLNGGGALPFGTLSFGNRTRNIAFSGGYGVIGGDGMGAQGTGLISLAGMTKVSKKVSLVFEAFSSPPGPVRDVQVETWGYVYDPALGYEVWTTTGTTTEQRRTKGGFLLMIAGARIHTRDNSAFQFGLTALGTWDTFSSGMEWVPLPVPMLQWYRTL